MRFTVTGALAVSVAMALSALSWADPQVQPAAVDHTDHAVQAKHGLRTVRPEPEHEGGRVAASILGTLDAAVSFCGAQDPGSKQKYRDVAGKATPGASEKDLREARSTSDYQPFYQTYTRLLNGIAANQRVAACHFLFFGQQ